MRVRRVLRRRCDDFDLLTYGDPSKAKEDNPVSAERGLDCGETEQIRSSPLSARPARIYQPSPHRPTRRRGAVEPRPSIGDQLGAAPICWAHARSLLPTEPRSERRLRRAEDVGLFKRHIPRSHAIVGLELSAGRLRREERLKAPGHTAAAGGHRRNRCEATQARAKGWARRGHGEKCSSWRLDRVTAQAGTRRSTRVPAA